MSQTQPQSPDPQSHLTRILQLVTAALGGGLIALMTALVTGVVDYRKVGNESEKINHEFVGKYLESVVHGDIHGRTRIAEYLSFVLADKTNRERWQLYSAELNKKYEKLRADRVKLRRELEATTTLPQRKDEIQEQLVAISAYLNDDLLLRNALSTRPPDTKPQAGRPPEPVSQSARSLLECAQAELNKGVRENPPGSNRGPEIDRYIRGVGIDPSATPGGIPWNIAFVAWCVAQAGAADQLAKTAHGQTMWNAGLKSGLAVLASDIIAGRPMLPGDIYFTDFDGRAIQAGIVTSVNPDGTAQAIVGNMSDSLRQVTINVRSLSMGVIRLRDADPRAQDNVQRFRTAKLGSADEPKLDVIATQILAAKARYEHVQRASGVPWFIVGVLHYLEADLKFDRHLHNGDPLTARTVHEPVGRPAGGTAPFRWEDSAADLLRLQGLSDVPTWDLAATLSQLERLNGFGYRRLGVATPYLWSCTDQYEKGKFIADGKFDPTAKFAMCGAAAILKVLMTRGQVSFAPAAAN